MPTRWNFTKGHTAAGRALVRGGSDGGIDLHNAGTVPVDACADLLGDDDVFPAGRPALLGGGAGVTLGSGASTRCQGGER